MTTPTEAPNAIKIDCKVCHGAGCVYAMFGDPPYPCEACADQEPVAPSDATGLPELCDLFASAMMRNEPVTISPAAAAVLFKAITEGPVASAAPIDRDSVLEAAAKACDFNATWAKGEADDLENRNRTHHYAQQAQSEKDAAAIRALKSTTAPIAVPLPAEQQPLAYISADAIAMLKAGRDISLAASTRYIAHVGDCAIYAAPLPLPAGPSEHSCKDCRDESPCEKCQREIDLPESLSSAGPSEQPATAIDFVQALSIAQGVFDKYKKEQYVWWRKMDGTPILGDVAVRMAEAFRDAAAPIALPAAVAGCKLVPARATEAMLSAAVGYREVDADDEITDKFVSMAERIYCAMIAAAPVVALPAAVGEKT